MEENQSSHTLEEKVEPTASPDTLCDDPGQLAQGMRTSEEHQPLKQHLGEITEMCSNMQLTVEESKLKVDSVSSMIATHMGREKSSSATTSASLHYICGAIANIQERLAANHTTVINDLDECKRDREDVRVSLENIINRCTRNTCFSVTVHAFGIFDASGLGQARLVAEAQTANGKEVAIFVKDTPKYYSRAGFAKIHSDDNAENHRASALRQGVMEWARGHDNWYEHYADWMDYHPNQIPLTCPCISTRTSPTALHDRREQCIIRKLAQLSTIVLIDGTRVVPFEEMQTLVIDLQ